MQLSFQNKSSLFEPLLAHTKKVQQQVGSTAASVMIIQNDEIVAEWYAGFHHGKTGAKQITQNSQFNVYSIRKTYIGLALAMAILDKKLDIETPIQRFIHDVPEEELASITLRHVLTKIKPKFFGPMRIEGEDLASQIVFKLTGSTISEMLSERVFKPLNLLNTQWIAVPHEELVSDYTASDGHASVRLGSIEGNDRNLHVSTRDLAWWTYLHMKKGYVNGKQIIQDEAFKIAEEIRAMPGYAKKRILGWYYEEERFMAAGATGCYCIVLPTHNAVAVRMFNRYDLSEKEYTEEFHIFDETLIKCLEASD